MYLICIESSHSKGMGHLFRSINLYFLLKNKSKECTLLLLNNCENSKKVLFDKGVNFVYLENHKRKKNWEQQIIDSLKPNIWINDRQNTNAFHARVIKNNNIKLVTFDDLGSGAKYCDIHFAPLANLINDNIKGHNILRDIKYLLLPSEIIKKKRKRKILQNIIVSLGGSDTYGVTIQVLKWLNHKNFEATVLLGPNFNHYKELENIDLKKIKIKQNVPSLIKEFSKNDFGIVGGGMTAFEAAASGLPTAVIANEIWEQKYAEYLQSYGCSIFLGNHKEINFDKISKVDSLEKMSLSGLDLFKHNSNFHVSSELINL